ncbi:hypothetical protein SFC07_05440 [Corynebacterium callunae]|uniref:hypothetical protein n=1 Tax=Corynebacterium callunae TaxID=1721 RepID=UPI0039822A5F
MIFSKSSVVKSATTLSLLGSLLFGTLAPAIAHAGTVNPNLGLSELGAGATVNFPGRTTEIPIGFKVPAGVIPEFLSGTLQVPAEYSGGHLELYSADRMLASIPIVPQDALAPVNIPLRDVPIVDGRVDMSLRVVMDVVGNEWCVEESQTTLLDPRVQFTGVTINPGVVADFFPTVLRNLTIYTPAQPSTSLQESALEIATSLGSAYRSSGVDIDVQALPEGSESPAVAPGDFERQIVLVDSPDTATTELINAGADNAFLKLSGTGDALYDQARLLTDAMLPLAVDTQVTAAGFGDVPNLATNIASLSELGITQFSSEGVGFASIPLGIERSRLETFSAGLKLQIKGTYTPQPDKNSGQISFSLGDTVLDVFTPDNSGVFDRKFEVPGELISRYNEIVVRYKSTGEISCGNTQPIGLTIDSNSLITSKTSATPVQSGFNALPQAFQPSVDVAMSEGSASNLSRAVEIVMGIQSLSSQRIRPVVVDWDSAVDSKNPTVFVDATGHKVDQIPTYLNQSGVSLEVTSKNAQNADNTQLTRSLQSNANLVSGSLQAVWDQSNNRIIVVASSPDNVRQLDGLLDWLDADKSRWTSLNGDVVVQVLDREPIDLSTVDAPNSSLSAGPIGIAVGIGLFIVAAIVAITIGISQRNKKLNKKRNAAKHKA